MPAPLVEVRHLAKRYPPPFAPMAWLRGRRGSPRDALVDVSFEIQPGEVMGLIGPNGAGKSTLLRILTGLLLPSEGSARVADRDVVRERPDSRREVGAALSEDRGLSPRLTAQQNLDFFAALFGLRRADADARIAELAHRFEATRLLPRAVRTLSTGEKARLVLIRSLLHRPKVLLIDELTRSLDPGTARRVRQQLLAEAQSSGTAVLFASHDLQEVESLSSRVLLLDGGRRAALGTFAEVKPAAEAVFARVVD